MSAQSASCLSSYLSCRHYPARTPVQRGRRPAPPRQAPDTLAREAAPYYCRCQLQIKRLGESTSEESPSLRMFTSEHRSRPHLKFACYPRVGVAPNPGISREEVELVAM